MSVDDVVITQEEIEAIRERAEKSTAGEWYVSKYGYRVYGKYGAEIGIAGYSDKNDALFIANARQDIPKLLAEIERLRNAISWGVSCSGCSNQLAEDWEIIGTSFVCRECIEYGGDSE